MVIAESALGVDTRGNCEWEGEYDVFHLLLAWLMAADGERNAD